MICVVSYILIFLLTSTPVFCGYVMEGGDAILWLERLREVRQNLTEGRWSLFPSPELITTYAGGAAAFDSGIWLLPMIGMQFLGIGEQMSYCIFMGMVGLGTMVSVWWMMRAFSEKKAVVLFGILFYMSCPCHIYICYDKADIGQAIVWALGPTFIGGIAHLRRSRGRSVAAWCLPALAYAGIWYADARWGVIAGVCMTLYLLLWKRWLWGGAPYGGRRSVGYAIGDISGKISGQRRYAGVESSHGQYYGKWIYDTEFSDNLGLLPGSAGHGHGTHGRDAFACLALF